jgi:hypothetical protein
MILTHIMLCLVSKNYREFTKAALITEQMVHQLGASSRYAPVVTRWEDILDLMRRAHDGESPDFIIMELFANQTGEKE